MKKIIGFTVAVMALVSCNPAPSAECVKYLKCTEAVSAGSAAVLKSTYDTGGTCWTTNQAAADACTNACKAAVSALASANATQAECK